MLVPLLPASAAPFAPRASSVSVVLGSKVEPWLTQTLKRINRAEQRRHNQVKQRRLNSVPQHQGYLTETLSSPNAIWTLTSIMLPKSPEADFKRDANNPLVEAIMNHEIIHIEGYVVCIDMVLRNKVTYRLTKDTIDILIEHHREVYCVDMANTCDGEQRCKKLHEKFVQAINQFVFHTDVSALEGLEEGGTGELLNGESEKVKNEVLSLMEHPHPRVGDVTQQTPVFLKDNAWPQHGMPSSQLPVELWGVPPSSPSVTSPASTDNCLVCVSMAQSNPALAPVFTQPHSTTHLSNNSPQGKALISTLSLSSMSAATHYDIGMAMSGMGGSCSFGSMPGVCGYACLYHTTQDDSLSSVVV
ncbi:hypothetical protein NW767_014779 [Fusarium falciforme]|uniref:Uncharacterized protein n=1 Tax=Fusarium falciforme TaxID=195108 RepID=A0A9W8QUD7_9HYPO|nr:hypothetical protein NW755_013562 [Fusarium falciforme]KAJ4178786.1 hypothetical protein NW767_014779 [Fusarium falciforme]KAJ4234138.1 hypothetical protein NW757_013656 [Fusarium falciforme]